MDLATLRKSRNVDFSKITSALAKTTETSYDKDKEDYFTLTKDKAGNASAVIRFLPASPKDGDNGLPWVQIYSRGFKGPTGKWYIENCLTTIGQSDPVGEACSALWNTGNEKDKEIAKQRKRKLKYFSNIYVVSDPGNRANEGKVFKFAYGKKIFEKITEKLEPTFEDEKPLNVFDLWEGANFKLRMRQVEGYPNYDQSSFGEPGPVAETDEEILEIVNKQFSLNELIAPNKFKSYDELKKKMESVLSGGGLAAPARAMMEDTPSAPAPSKPAKEAKAPKVSKVESEDDADDMEAYFKSIAE